MSDGHQQQRPKEDIPSSDNIVGVDLFGNDEVENLRFENPSTDEEIQRGRHDNRFGYNMRVRTENVRPTPQLPITGNEEEDNALVEIHQLAQATSFLPRDEIMARIREIQDKLKPKPIPRPRLPKPPPFAIEIDRDHPLFIRQFYSFVLTGKTNGAFRVDTTLVHFRELDFMDQFLEDLNEEAVINEIMKFLLKLKGEYFCQLKFFLMIYLKFVFSSNGKISKRAIETFDKFCDTGSILFQFMSLSEKLYNHIHGPPVLPELSRDELQRKRLARFEKMATAPATSLAASSSTTASVTSEIVAMDIDKPKKTKKGKTVKKKRPKLEKHEKKLTKPQKRNNKCKLKLRHKNLRRCFERFLDSTPPGLLLFFISRDVEWEKKEEFDYVDFKYLFKYLHPKVTKDADLKNVIITNHLSGNKEFKVRADKYMEKNSVLQNTENVVFNGILTALDLKRNFPYKNDEGVLVHNRNGEGIMLYNWNELGKQIRTKDSDSKDIKCKELSDEYSLDKESYFRLTFEHILEVHRFKPKVWIEIVEDLPYMLVLDKLEFIFQQNQLIGNKQLVFKLQMIIEKVNRMLAARIHPTQIISLYFMLQQKAKKNKGSTVLVQDNKNKVLHALYRAFHLSLQSDDMKKLFSTRKRHCLALDIRPQMFKQNFDGDSALTPINAALSYAMCLYSYEDYFHIYAFNKEMENVKAHFTKGMELNELREVFKQMLGHQVNYNEFLYKALDKRVDTDAFVLISANSPPTDYEQLSSIMTSYKSEMHRPDSRALLWQLAAHPPETQTRLDVPPDSPISLVQGVNKNVYHYLNAVVRFAGITARPVSSASCEAPQSSAMPMDINSWRLE